MRPSVLLLALLAAAAPASALDIAAPGPGDGGACSGSLDVNCWHTHWTDFGPVLILCPVYTGGDAHVVHPATTCLHG
jgi:hypothetical protein